MANSTMFTVMPISELCELIKKSVKDSFTNELKDFIKSSTKQEEKLLSIEEVCHLLKVSKVTIHKWKKQKKIISYRIGRKVYFKEYEIMNSIKSLVKA